jgi:hypothetical protein
VQWLQLVSRSSSCQASSEMLDALRALAFRSQSPFWNVFKPCHPLRLIVLVGSSHQCFCLFYRIERASEKTIRKLAWSGM